MVLEARSQKFRCWQSYALSDSSKGEPFLASSSIWCLPAIPGVPWLVGAISPVTWPSFLFFVATPWHVGSWFPDQGSNSHPLQWQHWECGAFTTGPPESPSCGFLDVTMPGSPSSYFLLCSFTNSVFLPLTCVFALTLSSIPFSLYSLPEQSDLFP